MPQANFIDRRITGFLAFTWCLTLLSGAVIQSARAEDDPVRDLGRDDRIRIDFTSPSKKSVDRDDDKNDYQAKDDDDRSHDSRDDEKPFEKIDWTSDFVDTDFRKESFLNSFEREKPKRYADDRKIKSDEPSYTSCDDKHKSDLVKWMTDFRDKRDYTDSTGDRKVLKELMTPIPGLLHDWVPARADRLHNGAFEKEPDNGFPVPYKLNGHLDIERKLPWEKEPP